MSISADINLSHAESTFAIANTPLFLLEVLRDDPAVRAISVRYHEDELIADLEKAVSRAPANLRESVLPFAILVALSLKPSASALSRTSTIKPVSCDPWFSFSYARDALINSYRATSYSVANRPVALAEPTGISATTTTQMFPRS